MSQREAYSSIPLKTWINAWKWEKLCNKHAISYPNLNKIHTLLHVESAPIHFGFKGDVPQQIEHHKRLHKLCQGLFVCDHA